MCMDSLPFGTPVVTKNIGHFFQKRLEGLHFREFIPSEKEFFEKESSLLDRCILLHFLLWFLSVNQVLKHHLLVQFL